MLTDELINDEWNNYYSKSAFKAGNTIASYKNSHRRITDCLGTPIHKAKPPQIIKAVKSLTENPNTRNTLLNCALVFFNLFEINTTKLNKYKLTLQKEMEVHRAKTAKEKSITLPTLEELNAHLRQLFADQKWKEYILMWLLMNYNTRNMDLDLEIVNSIHATTHDKSRNYLVRRKEDFVYIRNSYKTYKSYGQKRHYFKSTPMTFAIRYYIAELPPNQPIFLIQQNGERLNEKSVSNYVKNILPNNITETDVNKIQVSAINDLADYKKLLQMADRRGTEINTLITYYHLRFSEKDKLI